MTPVVHTINDSTVKMTIHTWRWMTLLQKTSKRYARSIRNARSTRIIMRYLAHESANGWGSSSQNPRLAGTRTSPRAATGAPA